MTDEELKGLFETMQRETRGELVAVRTDFATMRTDLADMRQEMRAEFAAEREKNAAEFAAVRQEIRTDFAAEREKNAAEFAAVRQENAAEHAETRRHFDITIEHMDGRIDFLAEGVMAVDQKLDRRCDSLEEKVDSNFSETLALIRYSYAELERRFGSIT